MRRFVLGWKMLGLERSLGSRIVTYADDLVILCERGQGRGGARLDARAHGQAEAGRSTAVILSAAAIAALLVQEIATRVLNQTRQSATVPTRCYRHR
jgi:hypothetical protein